MPAGTGALDWCWPRNSDRCSDVDALAVAQAAADRFELHDAVGEGKQGVVLAFADIDAGQNGGAALADQDGSGGCLLYTSPSPRDRG